MRKLWRWLIGEKDCFTCDAVFRGKGGKFRIKYDSGVAEYPICEKCVELMEQVVPSE